MVAPLALEIEHRIDHVLEHLGPGDDALLGDVADENDGEAARLRQADQRLRAAAHLRDRAGRAFEVAHIHGLDRIDDHHLGPGGHVERGDDIAHVRHRGERDIGAFEAEAPGAQADLVHRLLPRDVGRPGARAGHGRRGLEQECGLADAGVATHQDGRAGHQAAARDPVELRDPRGAPGCFGRCARERHEARRRTGSRAGRPQLEAARYRARGPLLRDRVPRPASVAAAHPLAVRGTTRLADEAGCRSAHLARRSRGREGGWFRVPQRRSSIWMGPSALPCMNWSTKSLPNRQSPRWRPPRRSCPCRAWQYGRRSCVRSPCRG